MKPTQEQSQAAEAFGRWMIDAGEAFARLQLEALRDSLEQAGRSMRIALEPQSPDKLVRMRSEMLAAEARRVIEFSRRYGELVLGQRAQLATVLDKLGPQPESYRRLLDAARTVQDSMAALARQSSGMWEAHLRASSQAIERALAGSGDGAHERSRDP